MKKSAAALWDNDCDVPFVGAADGAGGHLA